MPVHTYNLYAPEASYQAFAPLIAAEYNKAIAITTETDAQAVKKSPTRKLPLLECSDGACLFSSHAIARHVAGGTELVGFSVHDRAAMDEWMDFGAERVELPACVWVYPVAGYMPFQQEA
jgi:elongation factor 1-gamma